MAFTHPNGYYYCQLVIAGYGKLPRISLGTTRRADALRMEAAIQVLGRDALMEPRLHAILDALRPQGHGKPGIISPADVLIAHRRRSWVGLYHKLNDPSLSEVIAAYRAAQKTTRADGHAIRVLAQYGEGLCLSDLSNAGGVTRLLERIATGEKKLRASVARYEKTFLSKLLAWKLGRAERNRIFADVQFETEQSRRLIIDEVVTPTALRRMRDELRSGYFKSGDEWAPFYFEIALYTGATIAPLSRSLRESLTLIQHDGARWGLLRLTGTKNTRSGGRDRAIWLMPQHIDVLGIRLQLDPTDLLFPLRYSRFGSIWKKAVVRAGLDRAVIQVATKKRVPLRPHDTRRIFAMMAENAGLDPVKISKAGLGHASYDMTAVYQDRKTKFTPEEVERLNAAYG